MKNIIRYLLIVTIVIGFSKSSFAKEWPVLKSHKSTVNNKSLAEGCLPASGFTDLWVNNVRARINTGGDMWWDLQGSSKYFIPGNSKQTSMFSGSLWIGGLDINGQLKLAAQRYRGSGNDFWTGPISKDGAAATDAATCEQYDKHFKITRAEVEAFNAAFAQGFPAGYEIPRSIKDYPATDQNPKNSYFLAPFVDVNNDMVYTPELGDYPYYDFENKLCPINYPKGTPQPITMEGNGILADQVLKGDETLWWVFNDKGNTHTETGGQAVGMEIRAQAFAFSTNDDINNMTFYTYEIINRSTYKLTQTYFSQWVDTDIGYAKDDYVGCDVLRGLGYCYNGDDFDETAEGQTGYGANPPAVGVDFFQGPYMDPDHIDNPKYDINNPLANCNEAINGVNFGDSIVDNERFGMRRFVFHNNTAGGLDAITDPDIAPEYYNLLRGIWKDNTPMTYWGLGHVAAGGYGPPCYFMFPDNTDPCNWGTLGASPGSPYPTATWTEKQAGNPPYDRRFMQSAGPFTLEPGAVNYITVGIPWARATSGGPWASVLKLKTVDDKCQALFDNCFKILDGPDAPDLTVQELDKELILYLTNTKVLSNNYNKINEDYLEVDRTIIPGMGDSAYRFEGYQIFQLKDASVSVTDIHNADLARQVAQCDIKNGVTRIINYNYSDQLDANIPEEEVNGANAGIVHSFRVFEDLFATGDKRLVNHKQYYYLAIAYAYNNYSPYSETNPLQLDGQKLPYKAGRKASVGGIQVVSAMPHNPAPEAGGTILNSEYGVMPQITRLEGNGNGGLVLDFTTETHDQMMASTPYFAANPVYDINKGPLNIKVIDPLNVVPGNFTIKFIPPTSGKIEKSHWVLKNLNTNDIWNSDTTIEVANEQLLLDLGLSITIQQTKFPGDSAGKDNGFIEATIQFADSSKRWLTGVADYDAYAPYNWIRSGLVADANDATLNDYDLTNDGSSITGTSLDPKENYEKILDGTWAPYRMASKYKYGPQWSNKVVDGWNKLANLYSIDLYLTPDRSKWTKCVVIEECELADSVLSEGRVSKFDLRKGQLPGEKVGMGYFPGYAINVETGERLNMMFGEDSWLQGENGRDMIWNPTSNFNSDLGQILFGGKHWTYIMGHNGDTYNPGFNIIQDCPAYDSCTWIRNMLTANPPHSSTHTAYKRYVYKDVMWVGCPMISDVKYSFKDPSNMPCAVKIRIRVTRPYQRYYSTLNHGPTVPENDNYPMYSFNTEALATTKGSALAAEGSLNLINVVPNPYYAYSQYETSQLDNRVRITNLPQKCSISIYTVGGSLVRQFAKDNASSYVDWDLKNYANIPIAGGMYLIYIKVDGVGEKVLKWFGALRPIDLNSF